LGRRLGWIIASPSVIGAVKLVQQAMMLCPDTLHQMALTEYLKRAIPSGELERYTNKVRLKYKKAAQMTEACIDKHMGMRHTAIMGGLYSVVDVGMDGDKFVENVLKNTGVIFIPGKAFGKSLTSGIRVSFGPLIKKTNLIEEGFKRVAQYLKK
jgi:aspartate/methionine/tyrosine aminotransferase